MAMLNNVQVDLILGFYLYKKGNTIIENTLKYCNTNFSDNHFSISGSNCRNDTLGVRIKRLSNDNITINLSLIIINKGKQLKWKLMPTESKFIFNKKDDKQSKSKCVLPEELILNRVKQVTPGSCF